MQTNDGRTTEGRRSARLKIFGFCAIFGLAGIGLIVASVLVILENKSLEKEGGVKLEVMQYGGICGGILAILNAAFFAYFLMKIPDTDGLTQMIMYQCYFVIFLLLPYVGGAVWAYLIGRPIEDEKLRTLCNVIAGGCAIIVFSTISYLRFIFVFRRIFGLQFCKGMEMTTSGQTAETGNRPYTIGMS